MPWMRRAPISCCLYVAMLEARILEAMTIEPSCPMTRLVVFWQAHTPKSTSFPPPLTLKTQRFYVVKSNPYKSWPSRKESNCCNSVFIQNSNNVSGWDRGTCNWAEWAWDSCMACSQLSCGSGPLFGACVYARRPLWLHMRRLRDCIASCMDFGFGTEVSVAWNRQFIDQIFLDRTCGEKLTRGECWSNASWYSNNIHLHSSFFICCL